MMTTGQKIKYGVPARKAAIQESRGGQPLSEMAAESVGKVALTFPRNKKWEEVLVQVLPEVLTPQNPNSLKRNYNNETIPRRKY